MTQIFRNLMLLMWTLSIAVLAHAQQEPKPLQLKYTPIQETKWSMLSIYRVHLQDFGVTDKYNDTCNCIVDGKFLEKANANVGLSLYKNVDDKLSYSVDLMLGYGYTSRKSPSVEDKEQSWLATARADLYYHLMRKELQLRPYLFGALHASQRRGTLLATLPVGAGVRYMFFNNQAMLTAQVGYGLGLTNRLRNNAIYSSGLYVNLNKNYKPRQIDLGTPADRPVDKPHTHAATGSCYNCGAVVDTDCDGITDAIDKCPTVPGLAIHDGCPPVTMTDRDKDGIADSIDACPDAAGTMANMGCPANVVTTPPSLPAPIVAPAPAPIAVPTPAPPAPVVAPAPVTPVTSNTDQTPRFIIHFNFDRYNLTYNAIKILDAAVQYLKKNSEMKAYLYGHTDLYGANQYNVTLSLNRVNMARDYMINKGIKASRILTDHLGKTQPALSTMDKSIGWKNRRVEITVAK